MSAIGTARLHLTKGWWRILDLLVAIKEQLPKSVYQTSNNRVGYLLLLPGILLVGFLFVGMFVLGWYSVLTYDPLEFIIYEYTLQNWREFFQTPAFHRILLRTFSLSVIVTVLSVGLALPYAYVTVRTRSPLHRKLLLVGIFIPFFTGIIIRAYGWLIILGKAGLVNFFYSSIFGDTVQLIGTRVAVVIGLLQVMIPYAVLMIIPAIEAIDRSLERSAKSLGANRYRTARHVVVPLATPGLASATVVVFTLSVAVFSIPEFLGAGTVNFVANFIYTLLFSAANFPLGATLAVALVVISSIVVLLIFHNYNPGSLRFDAEERA